MAQVNLKDPWVLWTSVCTAWRWLLKNTTGVETQFVAKQVSQSPLWLRAIHLIYKLTDLYHTLSLCLETFLHRSLKTGMLRRPSHKHGGNSGGVPLLCRLSPP